MKYDKALSLKQIVYLETYTDVSFNRKVSKLNRFIIITSFD